MIKPLRLKIKFFTGRKKCPTRKVFLLINKFKKRILNFENSQNFQTKFQYNFNLKKEEEKKNHYKRIRQELLRICQYVWHRFPITYLIYDIVYRIITVHTRTNGNPPIAGKAKRSEHDSISSNSSKG